MVVVAGETIVVTELINSVVQGTVLVGFHLLNMFYGDAVLATQVFCALR